MNSIFSYCLFIFLILKLFYSFLYRTPAARRGQENDGPRISDATRISAVDEDQTYAVFITFTEVYNNTVFDLLDDTPIDPLRPGKIQAKILREDQHHNM